MIEKKTNPKTKMSTLELVNKFFLCFVKREDSFGATCSLEKSIDTIEWTKERMGKEMDRRREKNRFSGGRCLARTK